MPFISPLSLTLIDGNANGGRGLWRLNRALIYVDGNGKRFVVPRNFPTNLADQPSPWSLPEPATLHDYLIRTGIVSRREADDLFYEAMQSVNVPDGWASIAHLAVRSHSDSLQPTGPDGTGHTDYLSDSG